MKILHEQLQHVDLVNRVKISFGKIYILSSSFQMWFFIPLWTSFTWSFKCLLWVKDFSHWSQGIRIPSWDTKMWWLSFDFWWKHFSHSSHIEYVYLNCYYLNISFHRTYKYTWTLYYKSGKYFLAKWTCFAYSVHFQNNTYLLNLNKYLAVLIKLSYALSRVNKSGFWFRNWTWDFEDNETFEW